MSFGKRPAEWTGKGATRIGGPNDWAFEISHAWLKWRSFSCVLAGATRDWRDTVVGGGEEGEEVRRRMTECALVWQFLSGKRSPAVGRR
ncbi:hypothetical protein RHGRI_005089 [Rhododendron griersonianum]|uniref:Uncharacterized protein n=1 Tax=Rhododendron griersonianum TaxID=479676 RepID=A0AAV6LBZ8_9ERIC|nr:hypothetical protein RHGRI_005089 [Rhododendron griersonianum]